MDHLWSPWRYRYLTGDKPPESGCVFCQIAASNDDEANLVVHRGKYTFAVLNKFPYTSGHLMVVPYQHADSLDAVQEAVTMEIMSMTRIAAHHVQSLYRPNGLNIGMNIGEAAGAGIAGHIHMHVLPRWFGDANFMTTVAETRVLPEDLAVTWQRLRAEFAK